MAAEESRPSDGCPGADPRVSTVSSGAKYKSMSPARLPISRSPCLTIPPGLSPTTLLDSPVLLTNVKVEPSPTTGTFSIPSITNRTSYDPVASPTEGSDASSCEEGCTDDFEFKPRSRLCSGVDEPLGTLPPTGSEWKHSSNDYGQHSLGTSATSGIKPETEPVALNDFSSSHVVTSHERDTSIAVASAEAVSSKMQHLDDFADGIQASHMDNKRPDVLHPTDKTTEDGYNWRKYGQKHVKGSEFPRSYYKCTHPNCPVKKQLERSHDGQITDIIYKGKHDHPKPQPSRKLAIGAVLSGQEEERNDALSSNGVDDRSSKVDDQKCQLNDTNRVPDPSLISEVNNCEGPTEFSNNRYDDNADEDGDDPEAKRRRKESSSMDITAMNKITREPRVVIQTLSEVDILDDGYRWRKYGQKVVKGNPNPRSYYKCTNVGCPVRKHVERASHDPKAVITTYEGKHNHDVPVARSSSHDTAASMAINSGAALYNCIPVPMTCDGMRTASHNFTQHEDCDSISLDLGVGLSPRQKDDNNHQAQNPALERAHSTEIDSSSSDCSKLVMPSVHSAAYHGLPNNGTSYFGSTEKTGVSFSSTAAPVGHPSEPYKVNMGNLLMGP